MCIRDRVKTVEVKSPFAPLPEEAAKAPKAHRLTAEEKEIKAAVMDTLKEMCIRDSRCTECRFSDCHKEYRQEAQ